MHRLRLGATPEASMTRFVAIAVVAFGLITADGKCIPFDVDRNEKIAGRLKMKTDWGEDTVRTNPARVEVVGSEQGGKISVDEIQIK